MACGQCELQGVGRQVWLCLTGVGSQRNLAQRGPGWLGERDLPVCRRSSQPLRGGAWRTAGPRVPDCRRAGTCPQRAKLLLFATVPGRWRARAGRNARAWGGGEDGVCEWVVGPARERTHTARSGVQPLPGDRCGSGCTQTRVHGRGGHTPKQHRVRAVDPQN